VIGTGAGTSLLKSSRIKRATESDLPKIVLIENSSFDQPYPFDMLKKLLQQYGDSFLVAEESGKLVGYCSASMKGGSAHLISIGVLREYRRRGVGTSLLKHLIRFLRKGGVDELWLEVKSENKEAVSLYEKFGFERLNIVEDYYSDGSAALRMRLGLDKHVMTMEGGRR
jgi:ribosomal-protein-alanine N-acetyltransferase